MEIRGITKDEIDFAVRLTDAENWGATRLDFEIISALRPTPSLFVLEAEDELCGMVSTVMYDTTGFIGMLIVPKGFRNRGFGTMLMEFAIEYLEGLGSESIMLDAVERAVPLYENLGFRIKCRSLRFAGSVGCKASKNVRVMVHEDLQKIMDLDRVHFEDDRSNVLKILFEHFPQYSNVLIDDNDEVIGYAFGSQGIDNIRFGPCMVRDTAEQAEGLIRSILPEGETAQIAIGALDTCSGVEQLLRSMHLEYRGCSMRMIKGEIERGFSPCVYAIGSPAKG